MHIIIIFLLLFKKKKKPRAEERRWKVYLFLKFFFSFPSGLNRTSVGAREPTEIVKKIRETLLALNSTRIKKIFISNSRTTI